MVAHLFSLVRHVGQPRKKTVLAFQAARSRRGNPQLPTPLQPGHRQEDPSVISESRLGRKGPERWQRAGPLGSLTLALSQGLWALMSPSLTSCSPLESSREKEPGARGWGRGGQLWEGRDGVGFTKRIVRVIQAFPPLFPPIPQLLSGIPVTPRSLLVNSTFFTHSNTPFQTRSALG